MTTYVMLGKRRSHWCWYRLLYTVVFLKNHCAI